MRETLPAIGLTVPGVNHAVGRMAGVPHAPPEAFVGVLVPMVRGLVVALSCRS